MEDYVNCFIRHPRAEYSEAELGLPIFKLFTDETQKYGRDQPKTVTRDDFQVVNGRGDKIKCSLYRTKPPDAPTTVVIYW